MIRILFVTTIFLVLFDARGQDTLRITKPTSIATLDTSTNPQYHFIGGKAIFLPFTPYNSPFKYLKLTDSKPVIFTNTFFYLNGNLGLPRVTENIVSNTLEFDSCNLKYLNLAELSGSASIYNSKIGVLSIDSVYGSLVLLNAAVITNVAMIQNGLNISVDCQNTSFSNSAYMLILNSIISDFRFGPSPKTGSEFRFWSDTLKKTFTTYAFLNESATWNNSNHNIFRFQNCYIDANFVFFDEIPNSTFYFEGCTFGLNANLSDIPAHKVMFRSCRFLGASRYLGLHSKADTTYVSFINTNLDNIRFDYTPNTHLWFDTLDNFDVVESVYAHILKKFKDDGKSSAARVIDIEHQELTGNKLFNFVDRLWWNYGYSRINGLYWMILFLVLFFIFNMLYWSPMGKTYPIIDLNVPALHERKYLRQLLLIFLFTIYVFFSLRIDFSKIKYDRLGFVFMLFFQYAIGVWCLFFIARTLLAF